MGFEWVLTIAQVWKEKHWRSRELGEWGISGDGISDLEWHHPSRGDVALLTGEESLCRSHPDMEEKPGYRKGYLHRHFLVGLVEFHAALWFEHPYVGQGGEVSALEPSTLYQSLQLWENCEAVRFVFSEIHRLTWFGPKPPHLKASLLRMPSCFPSLTCFLSELDMKENKWSTQCTDDILSLPNLGFQLIVSFLKCMLLRLVYLDGRIVKSIYNCLEILDRFKWRNFHQKFSKLRCTKTKDGWQNDFVLKGCRSYSWPTVFDQNSSTQRS